MGRKPAERKLVFAQTVGFRLRGEAAVINWLEQFFHPWLANRPGAGGISIDLSASAEEYAALLAVRPAGSRPVPCFTLDTSTLALPARHTNGRVEVSDSERSCFFVVDGSAIRVAGAPGGRRWRFTAVLLIFELIAKIMRGFSIDMHAAAAEIDGRGVLIAGPKMAGKTTLSIYLLRSGLYRTVANDRCYIDLRASRWRLYGVPTPIKIRQDTLQRFPDLLQGFPDLERPYLYSMHELPGRPRPEADFSDRALALSPPQFIRQLGVDAAPFARLSLIVFPRVAQNVQSFELIPLDKDQLYRELRSNLYGITAGTQKPAVLDRFAPAPCNATVPGPDRLPDAITAYRLLLGRNAYRCGELARRLAELTTGAAV